MKLIQLAAMAALAGLSFTAAAQDSLTFQPGQYELTTTAKIMGDTIKEDVAKHCVTAQDNTVSYSQMNDLLGGEFNCAFMNTKKTTGRITTDVSCDMLQMDGSFTGKSIITHSATSFALDFDGSMTASGNKAPFALDMTGERISDTCG